MKIEYKDLGVDAKLDVLARLLIPVYKLDMRLNSNMKFDDKMLNEVEAKAWLALTQVTALKEKLQKYQKYMQLKNWKE